MKPGRNHVPPTIEDARIWTSVVVRFKHGWALPGILPGSRAADRRDADNMLNWAAWRHRNTYGSALLIREILEATHE